MPKSRLTNPWLQKARAFKTLIIGPNQDGSASNADLSFEGRPTTQRTHDERGNFQIEAFLDPGWISGTISLIGYMKPGGVGTILSTVSLSGIATSQLFLNVQIWPVMGILVFNGNPTDGLIGVYAAE